MSNAKVRHRRRWRKHQRMLRAVRFAAELAADWVERELAEGALFVGWLQVRPLGSEL